MNKNRILSKLEQDLSHFLISELCKSDPSKRTSSEMYRFKGLSLTVNTANPNEPKKTDEERVVAVQIGALEAQFKIENGDKVFGGLMPEDERLIQIWLARSENFYQLKTIFEGGLEAKKKSIAIIPFDLEDVYIKN